MTREQRTAIEGICWFIGGLFLMLMLAKYSIEYR
jgi:hypothetical protein